MRPNLVRIPGRLQRHRAATTSVVAGVVTALVVLFVMMSTSGSIVTPASGATATASVRCGWGTLRAGHWPTGCYRPYADSSVWNRGVPPHPHVLSNSRAMVAKIFSTGRMADLVAGEAGSDGDYYHPIYYSRSTDPVYRVHCTADYGRCAIEGLTLRIPARARPAAGSDGHMAVVDQRSGWEWDFWQVHRKPPSGGVIAISWGGRVRALGSGVDDHATRSGATAANQGLAAGLIRGAELQAGHIDHALIMSVDCTNGRWVYPATGNAAGCSDTTNAPPDGQRLYLAMSDRQISALHVSRWRAAILRALAHYGVFITDTGGANPSLFFESGQSYTSFGQPDPLVTYARSHLGGGIRRVANGTYHYVLAWSFDWTRYLRALPPPTR